MPDGTIERVRIGTIHDDRLRPIKPGDDAREAEAPRLIEA